VDPTDAAAEEVALGFLDAYAAFDAEKAMTYVADEADLTGVIDVTDQVPANTEGLSLRLSLLQAMGYDQTVTSCVATDLGSDTSVGCGYVFHAIGSDQIGRGPFSGGFFVLVRDGSIVRASWLGDTPVTFSPSLFTSLPSGQFHQQMWEPFGEWVSSTYPKDAAVMYLDGTLDLRFSLESIRLWKRHTREYVETGPAETAPPPAPASAARDVVYASMCSDGARWRLEVTDTGDRIKVRFEVYQSPVGHEWRIHLRHVKHNIFPVVGHAFFRGTRVASDSGVFVVQLRYPDRVEVDGVDGKAVDRQTGQVCEARNRYRD
jgi:hypothetical protein